MNFINGRIFYPSDLSHVFITKIRHLVIVQSTQTSFYHIVKTKVSEYQNSSFNWNYIREQTA